MVINSLPSHMKKIFDILASNKLVDHLNIFSDLQNDFRPSCSPANLLKAATDGIARAFNIPGVV